MRVAGRRLLPRRFTGRTVRSRAGETLDALTRATLSRVLCLCDETTVTLEVDAVVTASAPDVAEAMLNIALYDPATRVVVLAPGLTVPQDEWRVRGRAPIGQVSPAVTWKRKPSVPPDPPDQWLLGAVIVATLLVDTRYVRHGLCEIDKPAWPPHVNIERAVTINVQHRLVRRRPQLT